MSWHRAVPVAEVPVGGMRALLVDGQRILLCRVGDLEIHAVADLCSHDDGPLAEGVLTGLVLECPRHGARFDVSTGAVLRMPAAEEIAAYRTRIDPHGWIEVEVEDW